MNYMLDAELAARVAGAELPSTDPNPPREKPTRPWRNPSFWVDPKATAP